MIYRYHLQRDGLFSDTHRRVAETRKVIVDRKNAVGVGDVAAYIREDTKLPITRIFNHAFGEEGCQA